MSIDPATQRSKGFCFIEYDDPASAEASMVMNGFELAGRKIKVGRPNQGSSAPGAAAAPAAVGGVRAPALTLPPTLTVPSLALPVAVSTAVIDFSVLVICFGVKIVTS